MALRFKIPIQAKLLALIAVLLVGASAAYLALGIRIFEQDKRQLVFELNASTVKTLAAQIDASLDALADQARLLALQATPLTSQDELRLGRLLTLDRLAQRGWVAIEIYRPSTSAGRSGWQRIAQQLNAEYLQNYGQTPAQWIESRQRRPVPWAELERARTVTWNSALPGGAPLLSFAIRLGDGAGAHVVALDIRPDRLLEILATPSDGSGSARLTYLVDARGQTLLHPDRLVMESARSQAEVPIVRTALESPIRFQIARFDWQGQGWLGAYAKTRTGGVVVISQMQESQAFSAVKRLVHKSFVFAGIIVTLAILISIQVSRSLTDPLGRLVEATQRLARWDYSEPLVVRTGDEIEELAKAFNVMASDIQSHRSELEAKVRERTAEIERQRSMLAETQETLLKTTRLASLGELAGAAAHEILNPLNNINIRLERLRRGGSDEGAADVTLAGKIIDGWRRALSEGGFARFQVEAERTTADGRRLIDEDLANLEGIVRDLGSRGSETQASAQFIAGELVRVSKMVNNMRALSRVGGERRPVHLREPLERTWVTLADLIQKRGVRLIRSLGEGFELDPAFEVVADPDELVQVFVNIVRNGIQAIEQAGRREGELVIEAFKDGDTHAGRVVIRIRDNGSGIHPAHRERVFEPSFTTKSIEHGTGLGLAISRRIVRAFGGDVELESSQEGVGSSFVIWFPRSRRAQSEIPGALQPGYDA